MVSIPESLFLICLINPEIERISLFSSKSENASATHAIKDLVLLVSIPYRKTHLVFGFKLVFFELT